jgi:shikimate kinase
MHTEPVKRPHLVLVGMMGAGKTSLARRAARRLGRRPVDLDHEIERVAGRSIPEVFADEGEPGFRDRETAALRVVLAGDEPLVVATGGGAVVRPENRSIMRERGLVVWLRARPETLAARVGDGAGRPLLAGDPRTALERIATDRAPHYAAAAHEVLDVDDLPFDVLTDRLLAAAGLEVAP